jgi:hypothetical protein
LTPEQRTIYEALRRLELGEASNLDGKDGEEPEEGSGSEKQKDSG